MPTTTTSNTQPKPTMPSSIGHASSSMETPASDNLLDAITFPNKKPNPGYIMYMPSHTGTGQQPPVPSQAAGPSNVQSQQQVAGLAQQPATAVWQDSQILPQPQEILPASQSQMPISMSADPVRCVTWGPKTLYYVDNLPDDKAGKKKKTQKKKSNGKTKKDKKDKQKEIEFVQVVLSGSEMMQTTEKVELLGPEEGGGIKKTWVSVTRATVVSVEKQVEAKDVVVESSDESSSESEDTTSDDEETTEEEERRKRKSRKEKGKGKEKKPVKGKGKEVKAEMKGDLEKTVEGGP
ncbi:MAG: hypothetical protein Q9169_000182 [Polycauliona sp. 2 TL-2023]